MLTGLFWPFSISNVEGCKKKKKMFVYATIHCECRSIRRASVATSKHSYPEIRRKYSLFLIRCKRYRIIIKYPKTLKRQFHPPPNHTHFSLTNNIQSTKQDDLGVNQEMRVCNGKYTRLTSSRVRKDRFSSFILHRITKKKKTIFNSVFLPVIVHINFVAIKPEIDFKRKWQSLLRVSCTRTLHICARWMWNV